MLELAVLWYDWRWNVVWGYATKIELTLEQSQQGVSNDVLIHKMIAGIKDRHHVPSDAMHNPSQASVSLKQILFSFDPEIHTLLLDILSRSLILIRWQFASSLPSTKPKCNYRV
ncbi:hypothetical protein Tco_0854410 [Tanacetum coccineum]